MKKFIAVLWNLLVCCLLCSCLSNSNNAFAGQTPVDYESTRWTSQLGISFEVYDGEATGEMLLNGQTIPIDVGFESYSGYMTVSPKGDNRGDHAICYGRCSFSKEMLVVKLLDSSPKPFGENVERIVFLCDDIPTDNPSS